MNWWITLSSPVMVMASYSIIVIVWLRRRSRVAAGTSNWTGSCRGTAVIRHSKRIGRCGRLKSCRRRARSGRVSVQIAVTVSVRKRPMTVPIWIAWVGRRWSIIVFDICWYGIDGIRSRTHVQWVRMTRRMLLGLRILMMLLLLLVSR